MSYRKIQVNDLQYTYKIGRSSVHLRDPNGKGQVIPLGDITYYRQSSPAEIEIKLNRKTKPKTIKETIVRMSELLALVEDEMTIGPRDIRRWIEHRRTTTSIYRN